MTTSSKQASPAPGNRPQEEPSNSRYQTPSSFEQPRGNSSLWNHEPPFSGARQLHKTIAWFLFFFTALQNMLAFETPAGKSICKGVCLDVAKTLGRILPMLQ